VAEPYRTPPEPKTPDPYLVAWQRYRDRRAMKWVLFFGWPVAAAFFVGMMRFHTDDGPYVAWVVCGVGALVAMSVLGVFSCPRCGARMYVRSLWRDDAPDGCRACGIDVGTPKYPPGT
jgi:predicted RNA-binding Zn-ribbon protein involved in translation (DUF1610 family)